MPENKDVMIHLKYIKESVAEVKADVKEIKKSCACRIKECTKTFPFTKTFWKVVGVLFVLVSGSYAYAYMLFHLG